VALGDGGTNGKSFHFHDFECICGGAWAFAEEIREGHLPAFQGFPKMVVL